MNKNTGEYHSGDKSLMKEKLTQITKWLGRCDELDFAIRQLEKYGTRWVIIQEDSQYALFRKKIERIV